MASDVASTQAVAAKAVKQKRKKAAAPAHPPFKQMILDAIRHLKDSDGSSRQAIRKVIEEEHAPKHIATYLNKNLKKMTESGVLTHPKKHQGKYIISAEKTEKKRQTSKRKSPQKPKVVKKEARQKKKKVAEKKKKTTVKMAKKKTPVKKLGPKKVKARPSPKKSPGQKKKGRGRPKRK